MAFEIGQHVMVRSGKVGVLNSISVDGFGVEIDSSDEGQTVIITKHIFPVSALTPDALYLGDNGRCFCGELRCAGMTAYYSGRDLSGQKLMALTPEMLLSEPTALGFRCEGCGKEPHLIEVVR